MFFRNSEGYYDPTAGIALSHIMREERIRREREEKAEHRRLEKAANKRKALVRELFQQENLAARVHDKQWLREWPKVTAAKQKLRFSEELIPKDMSKRVRTRNVKGEKNPWQALANAIIIRAVKDYRNRTQMMNRIKKRLNKDEGLTPPEREYLLQRYDRYERLQDDAGDFFFSDLFAILCDLDGYDLLDRLNREVIK